MNEDQFIVGNAYYELLSPVGEMTPWRTGDDGIPIIESWIYAGYLQLECSTTSCDIPGHFYVFQRFDAYTNVLEKPPENGLAIPSLAQAKMSMLTLPELIERLSELHNH